MRQQKAQGTASAPASAHDREDRRAAHRRTVARVVAIVAALSMAVGFIGPAIMSFGPFCKPKVCAGLVENITESVEFLTFFVG